MLGVSELPPLVVVVGAGGVGKTTLAAALGLLSAAEGSETLVMTFDPSLRLKDALGVGEEAREEIVPVGEAKSGLWASLLDARSTFDRLVERYSAGPQERDRILGNRYYQHLAGSLAGILEYMAVERLFEVSREQRFDRIILDTPPTKQALDFLEAPSRIVGFLESGALKLALKPWFDQEGRLRPAARLGRLGRRFERFLDDVVGLDLLRDMAEFFQAFGPLYDGFRSRALQVESLLKSPETLFTLVAGPGEERIPDTLFFSRRLRERGHHLGPLVVNRVHPASAVRSGPSGAPGRWVEGLTLMAWLETRDRRGLEVLRSLTPSPHPVVEMPLLPEEPSDLDGLRSLARELQVRLAEAADEGRA